jgi:hypothetical protein
MSRSFFLFATSNQSTLISTNINNETLTLSGNETGVVSILITAMDNNGGLVTDEFIVNVGTVSIDNSAVQNPPILISPNPTSGLTHK